MANLPTGKALGGFFGNTGSTTGTQTVQPFGIDTGIDAGNTTGFSRWLDPQPLDASRTYTWDMPDLNEILLDINRAGPDWNKTPGGVKFITNLTNDPATRPILEQFPSKVLREGQSWKNMVTADDIDRLSSRMMGGGYFGQPLKRIAQMENINPFNRDVEDIQHWREGDKGYYQDILKDLDLDLDPFNIMYADELNELYRTDDQTIIPQFDLEPNLDIPFAPITFPEGTVAPYQGPVDWDFTPNREDWFPNEADAFTVQDDAEASLYPIGTTTGSLLEEPSTENLNTILMNTFVPMEGITETVETLPSGPEEMTEVVDIPEIVSSLPSGPEEMTEVFTEEDKAAEDERIRLDEIMTKAREDRIAQEKIAADARRAKEADERRARELREEAARAEDRQNKARLSREAEERDRKAQERAQEERNAAEAARLNSLAEAANKIAIDQARKQQEEQARKQAEFDRQHQRFMDQLMADNRNRGSYRGMQPGLAGPR